MVTLIIIFTVAISKMVHLLTFHGSHIILSNMSSYIHWYALHALLNYVHNCYVLCWIDDMRFFLDNNLDKYGDMVVKVLVDALERQLS